MNYIVLFSICATILFTLIPQSYAEYYYHDRPSWSIEYPDGWNVWEDAEIDAVHFMDGSEESALFGPGIWKNHYIVSYNQGYGEWESERIDRDYQIADNITMCEDAKVSVHSYTCDYFEVFHEIDATYTVDGYPIITTVFKHTNHYGMIDGVPGVGDKEMVSTSSYIFDGEDMWEFYTEHDLAEFDKNKSTLFNTLNSLRIPALPAAEAIPQTGNGGGGCLIATAAFGSEMAPQVQFLREIRDNTVLQTESGTSFMAGFNQFYYSFSPAIADYERENPAFKEAVKLTLTPLLASLTLLQYADIDSESEMLGYGIGVILLNIGMYFVAPAVLIMKVRKRI